MENSIHGEQKHFTFNHSNFYVEREDKTIYLLNYRKKNKNEEGLVIISANIYKLR